MSLTRRTLLGVVAGLVATACGPGRRRPAVATGTDVDAVVSALASEQALLADYDRAIASVDAVAAGRLAAPRQRHAAHVEVLRAAVASVSPPGSPPPSGSSSLQSSLRASASTLSAAAISAASGSTAALLASIAAEHAADATTTPDSP